MTSGNNGSGMGFRGISAVSSMACAAVLAASGAPAVAHPHVWVATETTVIFENGALSGLRYSWLFDEMYTASAIEGLDKNNDGRLDASELEELTKVNIEGLKEFDYFTSATMAGQALQFGDAKDYNMELKTVDDAPGPQMVAGPAGSPPASSPRPSTGLWSRFTGWFSGLFGRQPAQAPAQTAAGQSADQAKLGAPAEKAKVLVLNLTLPLKTPLPAGQLSGGGKGFQFSLNDPQMYIWFEPTGKKAMQLSADAPSGCRHAFAEPELDEEQKKLAEAFGRVGGGGVAMGGQGKVVTVICGKP